MTRIVLLVTAVAATVALPLLPDHVVVLLPELGLGEPLDDLVRYQLVTLMLALVVIGIARLLVPGGTRFLRVGQLDAPVVPVPLIGLRPKPHETWWHVGRNFAVILTGVTALVIYFQVLRGTDVGLLAMLAAVPVAIPLAVSNAFVEETLTRYAVLTALFDRYGPRVSYAFSAVLFGGVHYWGKPGGVVGVLLAGFLGWLLAKSLGETRGMGWAWFLHFLLDIVIFTAVIATAGVRP